MAAGSFASLASAASSRRPISAVAAVSRAASSAATVSTIVSIVSAAASFLGLVVLGDRLDDGLDLVGCEGLLDRLVLSDGVVHRVDLVSREGSSIASSS
jgi:hypothetical protein